MPQRRTVTRVAIVDEDLLTRTAICAIVAAQPGMRVLDDLADMTSALARLPGVLPDFVLLEAGLASRDQGAAVRAMRRALPGTKIIVFGLGTLEEEIFHVLDAGVCGYLLRGSIPDELAGAVQRAQSGERHIPPEVARRLAQRQGRREVTPRERRVLELLAEARSNATIAAVLGISVGTVKLHVKSILAKLAVEDRTEAAVVAMERGFVRQK